MKQPAESFSYRGVCVNLQIERARGLVFGHADLLAGGEFMNRVSLGSGRSPDEVRERLRCLAKAKIDLAEVVRTAEAECARCRPSVHAAKRGQGRRKQST